MYLYSPFAVLKILRQSRVESCKYPSHQWELNTFPSQPSLPGVGALCHWLSTPQDNLGLEASLQKMPREHRRAWHKRLKDSGLNLPSLVRSETYTPSWTPGDAWWAGRVSAAFSPDPICSGTVWDPRCRLGQWPRNRGKANAKISAQLCHGQAWGGTDPVIAMGASFHNHMGHTCHRPSSRQRV